MDITWYGHSCFRLAERGRITSITDPFADTVGLPVPKLKGDVVTVSHDMPGHNHLEAVKGTRLTLTGPGEYEISGVYIQGIAMHDAETGRRNVAYAFNYDSLTVLHVGDLSHVPDQRLIEDLGQVNVLMLPVGGGNALRAAQAAEVVALIEPYFVIPMHYALPGLALELDGVDKFLKAMGVSAIQETELFKVTAGETPELPQVVLLSPSA